MKATKSKFSPRPARLSRMRGMTLLGLLLATAIGIIVVGGVLLLYVNAQESAAQMNAASRVQESGRFATDHLARTMRMTGYDDPITTATPPVSPALAGTDSSDTAIATLMSGVTLKSGTDVIQISHEGAPGIRDCQGIEVATDSWVTNTYAVSRNNELVCATQTTSTTTTTTCGGFGTCTTTSTTATATAAPTIIAEGVEDLELRYGVDTDADGIANRYVLESNVANWTQVVSAKAALLVNSVENVFASTLHGCESCNTFNPATSNLLRAEFHATVRFRNM